MSHTHTGDGAVFVNFMIAIASWISWNVIFNFTLAAIPSLITAVGFTIVTTYVKYRYEKYLKRNDKDKNVDIDGDDLV
jgi:hypothetical protein